MIHFNAESLIYSSFRIFATSGAYGECKHWTHTFATTFKCVFDWFVESVWLLRIFYGFNCCTDYFVKLVGCYHISNVRIAISCKVTHFFLMWQIVCKNRQKSAKSIRLSRFLSWEGVLSPSSRFRGKMGLTDCRKLHRSCILALSGFTPPIYLGCRGMPRHYIYFPLDAFENGFYEVVHSGFVVRVRIVVHAV